MPSISPVSAGDECPEKDQIDDALAGTARVKLVNAQATEENGKQRRGDSVLAAGCEGAGGAVREHRGLTATALWSDSARLSIDCPHA